MSEEEDLFNLLAPSAAVSSLLSSPSCTHPECSTEKGVTICVDCGLEMEREYGRQKNWVEQCNFSHRLYDIRTIARDVKSLNLSDEVINHANELYTCVTQNEIRRANQRRGIICACIFTAFKNVGVIHDLNQLAAQFKLTQRQALQGMKKVKESLILYQRSTHTPPLNKDNLTTKDFIELYLNKLEAPIGCQEQVFDMYELLMKYKRHEDLQLNTFLQVTRIRPRALAAALIYMWIEENKKGKEITREYFAQKIVHLSALTIEKTEREVKGKIEIILSPDRVLQSEPWLEQREKLNPSSSSSLR